MANIQFKRIKGYLGYVRYSAVSIFSKEKVFIELSEESVSFLKNNNQLEEELVRYYLLEISKTLTGEVTNG